MNPSRRKVLSYLGATAVATAAGAVSGCGLGTSTTRTTSIQTSGRTSFDVVIIGATPGGIKAAQAAVREGATVAIIESSQHVGGMYTSGLGVTDSNDYSQIGGLAAQFFKDVGAHYGKGPWYFWEPHVAAAIFNSYLDSPNIWLFQGRTLSSAAVVGTQIKSITLDDDSLITGNQWIDASYEGDLMALSGTAYTIGRESIAQYKESYAGWGNGGVTYPFSPYQSDGVTLIPDVNPAPPEKVGEADHRVMAYNYRTTLTQASNRLPFPMPAGYDNANYEGVLRSIAAYGLTTHVGLFTMETIGGGKFCTQNCAYFSTDYPGLGKWTYPDGNWATRNQVIALHLQRIQGFFYFLANDPAVPSGIRSDVNTYGLPADEYAEAGGWPWMPYIREGRRMIGQYIMTQADVNALTTKPDSIGINQWCIDVHEVDRIVRVVDGVSRVAIEGCLGPYTNYPSQIPFRTILSAQITNLAVPVCMSASHIGFSALRVEPTFMTLGEAAGTAAVLALDTGVDLAQVNVATLQAKLLGYGGILNPVSGGILNPF